MGVLKSSLIVSGYRGKHESHRKWSQTLNNRCWQLIKMSTAGGVELWSKGSLGLGSRDHYPAIDSMALWEGELHGAKSSSYSREVGKAEFM